MPVATSSSTTPSTVRCGASSTSPSPKPAALVSNTGQLTRPIEAEISAPISAPAPKQAVISPNTSAPARNVSLATSGSSTVKLMQTTAMKVNIVSATSNGGV